MAPEVLKLFFRLGMFITIAALFLVFTVPRGTAEYVVSVLSLIIGLVLIALVAAVSWWSRK
jgi:uncharacterized membrane protein YccC